MDNTENLTQFFVSSIFECISGLSIEELKKIDWFTCYHVEVEYG